jgi:hypothetical protein
MDFVEDLHLTAELTHAEGNEWGFRLALGAHGIRMRAVRHPRWPTVPASTATFEPESPRAGALFWRGIAEWLGVPVPASANVKSPQLTECLLLSLGPSDDEHGQWNSFRWVLGEYEDSPSAYIRIARGDSDDRARLSERDISTRSAFVDALRTALGDVPGLPAVVSTPKERRQPRADDLAEVDFGVGDQVEFVVDGTLAKYGSGVVDGIEVCDVEGARVRMVGVRLASGDRALIPASSAVLVLKKTRLS